MNRLIILLGGSGSGKTTTEQYLINNGFQSVVSCTTREKREGEEEGIHYFFIDKETLFSIDKANIIKITDDWFYCVKKEELLKGNNLCYSVINIEPANQIIEFIKKENLDIEINIVYFNIPKEIRKTKMIERGEKEESINIRLGREDDISVLDKFGLKADYVISNFSDNMQDNILKFLEDRNGVS